MLNQWTNNTLLEAKKGLIFFVELKLEDPTNGKFNNVFNNHQKYCNDLLQKTKQRD